MQGAYAIVRDGSSASNLLEPHHHRDNEMKSTKVQNLGAECDVVSVWVPGVAVYNDTVQYACANKYCPRGLV